MKQIPKPKGGGGSVPSIAPPKQPEKPSKDEGFQERPAAKERRAMREESQYGVDRPWRHPDNPAIWTEI